MDSGQSVISGCAPEPDFRWRSFYPLLEAERILVEEDAAIIPLYSHASAEVTKPLIKRTYGKGGQQAFEKWSLDLERLNVDGGN